MAVRRFQEPGAQDKFSQQSEPSVGFDRIPGTFDLQWLNGLMESMKGPDILKTNDPQSPGASLPTFRLPCSIWKPSAWE